MGTAAIVFSSIGGYLAVAMTGYRMVYRRRFRQYRTWQRENPTQMKTWRKDYQTFNKQRKDVDYDSWQSVFCTDWEYPPAFMFIWPLTLSIQGVIRYLRPEVKVADLAKVDRLEKELKELD